MHDDDCDVRENNDNEIDTNQQVHLRVGVAIAFLLLVVVGMLALGARQATRDARDVSAGSWLAAERMAQMQQVPFADLAPGTRSEEIEVRATTYHLTTTVTPDSPAPGLKSVTVEVAADTSAPLASMHAMRREAMATRPVAAAQPVAMAPALAADVPQQVVAAPESEDGAF